MARRVEVSFLKPNDKNDMMCGLYNLPNNDWIGDSNFESVYKLATDNQRKKLLRLKNNRELEVVLNLNVADLRHSREITQQKIYTKKSK